MDYISFIFDIVMGYIALFIAAAGTLVIIGAPLYDIADDIHESNKKKQYAYARKENHYEHQ